MKEDSKSAKPAEKAPVARLDQFAGTAMHALLMVRPALNSPDHRERLAEEAYEIAEAMCRERKKVIGE